VHVKSVEVSSQVKRNKVCKLIATPKMPSVLRSYGTYTYWVGDWPVIARPLRAGHLIREFAWHARKESWFDLSSLNEYGGRDGIKGSWLLVQHQDFEIKLQKSFLKHCNFSSKNKQYLTDKILVNKGENNYTGHDLSDKRMVNLLNFPFRKK